MRWGAFNIEVALDGAGFWLLHGEQEWAAFTLEGMRPTGRFTDDADEVEHGFGLDVVSCAVRHSVGQAWTLRWALNTAELLELRRPPRLLMHPAPGCVAWAWAAGAEAALAIAPAVRSGPIVGLRLGQGWLRSGPDGFSLAPDELALTPGRRWIGGLKAELYPSVEAMAATLPSWLGPLELSAGQPWEITQPDQALVVHPPASTRAQGDAVQVYSEAGRAEVALHSPRGLTTLTLSFAPSLDTLLAAGASAVLRIDGPVSAAAAFVVTEALGRRLISDPAAAEGWLVENDWDTSELLAIASAIVRAQRGGQVARVRASLDRLSKVEPRLGFGRVAMAGWLAGLALGEDVRGDAMALFSRHAVDEWGGLELNVLNLRSAEVAGPLFTGLINALGGDLPGEPVGLDAVQQAQLTGLLQLCPEEWPMAAAAAGCATKNSRRLLAGVAASNFADPDDLAVLAWLALGESLV